jgi:hypothetical protein
MQHFVDGMTDGVTGTSVKDAKSASFSVVFLKGRHLGPMGCDLMKGPFRFASLGREVFQG